MDFLARGADPGSGEEATGVAAGRPSTGDVLASGEVLESGPQALGESGLERLANDARRWARGADDSAKPWLRRAVAATAALAVTGAVVALRAAAPTIPLAEEAAAADITLQLRWTGRAYAWQGWPTELARCA